MCGIRGAVTHPDVLRLMVNCSHMSEASRVSWGPTKPSSCSQNSLVTSTEAEIRSKERKQLAIKTKQQLYLLTSYEWLRKSTCNKMGLSFTSRTGKNESGRTIDHKTSCSAHCLQKKRLVYMQRPDP